MRRGGEGRGGEEEGRGEKGERGERGERRERRESKTSGFIMSLLCNKKEHCFSCFLNDCPGSFLCVRSFKTGLFIICLCCNSVTPDLNRS